MSHPANDDEARIKVREMLETIGTVMLVTMETDGSHRSRPMAIQKIEGDTVWFFNDHASPKTSEIADDSDVLLAGANPSSQDYVSVKGTARAYQDVAKQQAIWSESARVWFPKGSDDPGLGLIAVTITGAEYWDSPSSIALHAYGYLKAVTVGERPEGGESGKVAFGR